MHDGNLICQCYLMRLHLHCYVHMSTMVSCMHRTFVFVNLCGCFQHNLWARSMSTWIARDANGCKRMLCLDVIVWPSFSILIWVSHITHSGWEPGMQMKSEESHFEFGEGHQKRSRTYTHVIMHVGMCWMCFFCCSICCTFGRLTRTLVSFDSLAYIQRTFLFELKVLVSNPRPAVRNLQSAHFFAFFFALACACKICFCKEIDLFMFGTMRLHKL